MESTLNVGMDELLKLIGSLYLENILLKAELAKRATNGQKESKE